MWTFVLKGVSVFIMHILQHNVRLAWVPGCCQAHIPCVAQCLNDKRAGELQQQAILRKGGIRAAWLVHLFAYRLTQQSWTEESDAGFSGVWPFRRNQIWATALNPNLHSCLASTADTTQGVSNVKSLLTNCSFSVKQQREEKKTFTEGVSKFQMIQCPLKWDSRPILHCNRKMFRDISELVCTQQYNSYAVFPIIV